MAKPCLPAKGSGISRHSGMIAIATRMNLQAVARPESAIRVRPEF